MKIIDIDKLIEIDNHIYYIKIYRGSLLLMENNSQIVRKDITFSIEYKPIGDHVVKAEIKEMEVTKAKEIMDSVIKKINKLDEEGVLARATKEQASV